MNRSERLALNSQQEKERNSPGGKLTTSGVSEMQIKRRQAVEKNAENAENETRGSNESAVLRLK